MQPLATQFADQTFQYTQLAREGDLAIFEQRHKASGTCRYEVVRIRVVPENRWPNGEVSPEREVYPGANSWGRLGWTCWSIDQAQALLAQLQAKTSAA